MDLRTRYTSLVTLTTQHVKYISDALRRLEEEEVIVFLCLNLYPPLFFFCFFAELIAKRYFASQSVQKEVEEEKQARVGQVSDLLGWVKGLCGRSGGSSPESSIAAQQVLNSSFFSLKKLWLKLLRPVSSHSSALKAISEQLAARKDQVAEAIRSTQTFLRSKQAAK